MGASIHVCLLKLFIGGRQPAWLEVTAAQKWEPIVIVNPITVILIVTAVPTVTVIPWPSLCCVGHPFTCTISFMPQEDWDRLWEALPPMGLGHFQGLRTLGTSKLRLIPTQTFYLRTGAQPLMPFPRMLTMRPGPTLPVAEALPPGQSHQGTGNQFSVLTGLWTWRGGPPLISTQDFAPLLCCLMLVLCPQWHCPFGAVLTVLDTAGSVPSQVRSPRPQEDLDWELRCFAIHMARELSGTKQLLGIHTYWP
jgi:hypothetical protein